MKELILNDTLLWEWLDPDSNTQTQGISAYLKMISENQIDNSYIIELYSENRYEPTSQIMNNLAASVPRSYFLELHFCAKAYASVFGRVFPPLASHVDELAYIEWLLYTEPENGQYRDHLVHMFKVAFAGAQLLSDDNLLSQITEYQFKSPHFRKWCEANRIGIEEWDKKKKEEVVRMAFFLAALFHDFGYGYAFLRKYTEKLSRVYHWLLPGPGAVDINTSAARVLLESLPSAFIRKYHGWLRSESGRLTDEVIAGFYRDSLSLNHSMASTFFILDLAEKLTRARALSQNLYVSFQLAGEVCMIHDMVGPNSWVHLERKTNDHFIDCNEHKYMPVAMLLILSDELGIWNRPRLGIDLVETKEGESVVHRFDRAKVPHEIKISMVDAEGEIRVETVPDQANEGLKKAFKKLACLRTGEGIQPPRLLDYRIDIISRTGS